jgi:hypothetical protein
MLSYYLVGFLDILGFSQMVREDCQGNPDGPVFLPRIRDALVKVREQDPAGNFRLAQFSDSIIVSRPFQRDQNIFADFLNKIASLQELLFVSGILSRGGIAHGKHSEDDGILFSQALVEAYRIESSVSQFPRTIVSEDLLLLFSPAGCRLATDRDGLLFVDYLRNLTAEEAYSAFQQMTGAVDRDRRVQAKAQWVQDYISARFPASHQHLRTEMQFFDPA